MEAFLVSAGIVALAEIGDKTQLLSLILAARFKKPLPIIIGIFVSTIVNHALAGAVGAWITHVIGPDWMRWLLGASFIAMAIWILVPDSIDDGARERPRHGVFVTTVIAFFLAEMGDKTQIATVALAARFPTYYYAVIAGTTLGLMLVNVPTVLFGERVARALPIRAVHVACALVFLALGALTLFSGATF